MSNHEIFFVKRCLYGRVIQLRNVVIPGVAIDVVFPPKLSYNFVEPFSIIDAALGALHFVII